MSLTRVDETVRVCEASLAAALGTEDAHAAREVISALEALEQRLTRDAVVRDHPEPQPRAEESE